MARLKEYNGYYCESEYEYAFIGFLETEGWIYSSGNNISRVTKRDVLIADDFKKFIVDTNPDLTEDEVTQIFDNVRLVGSESDFATLHKVYGWMVNGIQFTPQDGIARMIPLIDFKKDSNKNIFRVVNQFTVEYTNNGQKENRRPDVLLFVNGMPLCVIELKNPADANATIYDAWEQINIRYWRDIPHLLHYCTLACISDGVKTRLGTVHTPYEHFYAWRRVNDGDAVYTLPFEETETMIKGVYAPERFLEIFRDYIYFQDSIYDSDEVEIVCRYPQFFAARLLRQSIINSVVQKSGKGGTYFGATGCGKTYTMAFLARQLALRCTDIPEIGSPTIILIVDRDELQKQGAKLFTKSKEFLNLGEVAVVKNRAQLRQELGARQSGGFYICTIQKFCDREDDKIGLINDRQNIICFSDEAHRTQLEHSKKIQFSKDADENMKAMVSKPYAKVLKEAFPQATFVGFTGTPIAETYQTFGDEIDRYTMDQAVADGLTVSIKYHPRIAKVLLDKVKVKEIEDYYKKCANDGATYEDIEASKKAMSSMEVILGEPSRLERLATDIHDHYISSCAGDPDRIQKAMVVCSNRKIAYALLQKFKDKYPEWFEEKKSPDGVAVTEEELKELKPMPFIAMVSSVGSNDEKDMYNYLGGVKNDKRSEELDAAFKQEKSNFHIVIVVDMWITGFDVPCLTYLYNDKPLKKHLLIQTISRVNRKYPGKQFGMVIDYIGIRNNMREAMKVYGGDTSVAPTSDDVEQATSVFREELEILKTLFSDYDLSPFLNPDCAPIERYRLLAKAAEYARKAIDKSGATPMNESQWHNPTTGFNTATSAWMWYLHPTASNMGNLANFIGHISNEADWGYASLSKLQMARSLYDAIPATDFRKYSYLDPDRSAYAYQSVRGNAWLDEQPDYMSLKFRPVGGDYNTYSVGAAADIPVMRVEEMYLIEAEAVGASQNVAAGVQLLNNFMKQYRQSNYNFSTGDLRNFQLEVLKQMRIEFWGEGIAFPTAKRLKPDVIQNYEGTNFIENIFKINCKGVKPNWTLMIPKTEVDSNTALQGMNNPDPSGAIPTRPTPIGTFAPGNN